MSPLLSVITTVYNRENFLSASIESVLSSTFGDFEYIIVDDNSTDDSLQIANYYARCDSRIRVYSNEINIGDYPNRNRGLDLSLGKLIKYVDSDDCIYPHSLQVMVDCMNTFPEAGYGISARTFSLPRPCPFQLSPSEAFHSHYEGQIPIFNASPLSAIIRKEAILSVGKFLPEKMVGDFDMWHKLSTFYPVIVLPGCLGWYRSHDSQQVSDLARRKFYWHDRYNMISIASLYNAEKESVLNAGEVAKFISRLRKTELLLFLHCLRRFNLIQSLLILERLLFKRMQIRH